MKILELEIKDKYGKFHYHKEDDIALDIEANFVLVKKQDGTLLGVYYMPISVTPTYEDITDADSILVRDTDGE